MNKTERIYKNLPWKNTNVTASSHSPNIVYGTNYVCSGIRRSPVFFYGEVNLVLLAGRQTKNI
jgi:hypothetical protein